jgi:signal transduction histidine kinase
VHKLLQRQLERAGLTDLKAQTPEVAEFVKLVDAAYKQNDDDRVLLERSMDLSSQELFAANQELRAGHERQVRSEKLMAIGKLASGVGHELRNPLGAIRNALYYIADTLKESGMFEKDEGLREMLGVADREILSAMRIIGDLLDFTRVQKPLTEPLVLPVVLAETVRRIEAPPGVEIKVSAEAGLPRVLADGERLAQVVINVATNAIQAMGEKGRLTISAAPLPQGPGPAMMAVDFTDTGPGIPAEAREKVFEPLFSTKAKGTGLGLPICVEIMNAHGGSIVLLSTGKLGTTFRLSLPIAAAQRGNE